jgi:hypothetical protein
VPKPRQDRIGVLIIRAFVEEGPRRALLVQLLEVNPASPDRVIGIVNSSSAACRLVGQWLDALDERKANGSAPQQSADFER